MEGLACFPSSSSSSSDIVFPGFGVMPLECEWSSVVDRSLSSVLCCCTFSGFVPSAGVGVGVVAVAVAVAVVVSSSFRFVFCFGKRKETD